MTLRHVNCDSALNASDMRLLPTLLLIISGMLSCFSLLDPYQTFFSLNSIVLFKYMPIILSFGALLTHFTINWRITKTISDPSVICIFIVFSYMMLGSFEQTVVDGRDPAHSFMGRALGLLCFLIPVIVLDNTRKLSFFVRYIGVCVIFIGATMAIIKLLFGFGVIFQGLGQIYHTTSIFIAIAGIFSIYNSRASIFLPLTVVAVPALALSDKWTSFGLSLLLGLCLLHRSILYLSNVSSLSKVWRIVFGIAGGLVAILAVVWFTLDKLYARPGDLRWLMWEQRSQSILEQPWFGTGFADSPLFYVADMNVPSHNDLLDILYGGGVLSLFLILVAVFRILIGFLAQWNTMSASYHNYARLMFLILALGIANINFNPMIHLPTTAFLFWSSAAVCLATHRMCVKQY